MAKIALILNALISRRVTAQTLIPEQQNAILTPDECAIRLLGAKVLGEVSMDLQVEYLAALLIACPDLKIVTTTSEEVQTAPLLPSILPLEIDYAPKTLAPHSLQDENNFLKVTTSTSTTTTPFNPLSLRDNLFHQNAEIIKDASVPVNNNKNDFVISGREIVTAPKDVPLDVVADLVNSAGTSSETEVEEEAGHLEQLVEVFFGDFKAEALREEKESSEKKWNENAIIIMAMMMMMFM